MIREKGNEYSFVIYHKQSVGISCQSSLSDAAMYSSSKCSFSNGIKSTICPVNIVG